MVIPYFFHKMLHMLKNITAFIISEVKSPAEFHSVVRTHLKGKRKMFSFLKKLKSQKHRNFFAQNFMEVLKTYVLQGNKSSKNISGDWEKIIYFFISISRPFSDFSLKFFSFSLTERVIQIVDSDSARIFTSYIRF